MITDELTGFKLTAGGQAWMQGILPIPHHVNYERRYARVTDFTSDARYSFPALYQTPDKKAWALITEAGLDYDDTVLRPWSALSESQRRAIWTTRPPWWTLPAANTLDRATAHLPRRS